MPAETGPMLVVIDKEDQELPHNTSSHAGFVRCAITNGLAMPLEMASDPLGFYALLKQGCKEYEQPFDSC